MFTISTAILLIATLIANSLESPNSSLSSPSIIPSLSLSNPSEEGSLSILYVPNAENVFSNNALSSVLSIQATFKDSENLY